MDAYETLHYIDTLLYELWYTDEGKSDTFNYELYEGIEKLYSSLDELEQLKLETKILNHNKQETWEK